MISKASGVRAVMLGSAAMLLWIGGSHAMPLAGPAVLSESDQLADFSLVQPVACARFGKVGICDRQGRREISARREHARRQGMRDADAREHARRQGLRDQAARAEAARAKDFGRRQVQRQRDKRSREWWSDVCDYAGC